MSKPSCSRLIIIDDHPLFRRGLASIINELPDMTVCAEAENHSEALDLIASEKPDVVTIDISLGQDDGLSLIRDIHDRFSFLPMLVISMHDETLYAERSIRAGASGFISKQEVCNTVVSALRKVLKGEDYVSQEVTSLLTHNYLHGISQTKARSVASLSNRQLEVFRRIGEGLSTRQIAERLNLSVKTVETHRENIKCKLTLQNGIELARAASLWLSTGSIT